MEFNPNVTTAEIGIESMLDMIHKTVCTNKTTLESTTKRLTAVEKTVNTVVGDVSSLTATVNDNKNAAAESISAIDFRVGEIELAVNELKAFKSKSEVAYILGDLYNKRFNILFHGFEDKNQEESMEDRLKNASIILNDILEIPNANDIVIVDTHRLPQTPIVKRASRGPSKPVCRPVVIKVTTVEDRKRIFDAMQAKYNDINDTKDENEKLYATRHLPKSMCEQRKNLLSKSKKARKEGKKTEWKIDYVTADYCLYIDGVKVPNPKTKKV